MIATCWVGGGFDSLIRNVWAGGKSDLTVVDDWVRTKNGLTMDGVALNHYSIPNFGKAGERVMFKRQSIFRSFYCADANLSYLDNYWLDSGIIHHISCKISARSVG